MVAAAADAEMAMLRAADPRVPLVREDQVTHVLVLSDTPDRDQDTNRRLAGRLRELGIRYTVTLPMRVDDGAVPDAETP